jgi:carbon storage regulator
VLILGRRVGESIVIDGGITIVVLACDRGGVRLGVRAPAEVTILRGEIVDQVTAENRRAPPPPARWPGRWRRRCARRPRPAPRPRRGASA